MPAPSQKKPEAHYRVFVGVGKNARCMHRLRFPSAGQSLEGTVSFAIIKVMRIKTRADLIGLTAHGRRLDRSPHVDRSRSHLNYHWSPPTLGLDDPTDLAEAVDAVIAKAGAKTHKGVITHPLVSGVNP